MKNLPNLFLSAALLASLSLAACGDKPAPVNEPNTPTGNSSETVKPSTTPAEDAAVMAKAKEVAAKAWEFLGKNYNNLGDQPKNPIGHFWGPDCNPGMSSFVVLGAVKAGVVEDTDQRIKDTVQSILAKQGANGSFDFDGNGMRAVYLTSAALQCMSYLRDHGSDFYTKGEIAAKLKSASEKAMAYLKSAQVGAPDSPMSNATADSSLSYGGWAYSEQELSKSKGKPAANMSTTIFALDGANAFGLNKNDDLYKRAVVFLKRNQNAGEVEKGIEMKDDKGREIVDPDPSNPSYGGGRYSPETTKPLEVVMDGNKVLLGSYGSMTYALLRGYLMSGLKKDDVPVQLAYQWICRNFVLDRVPGFVNTETEKHLDQQGLYYQYMQMAKTLTLFGENKITNSERGIQVDWRDELVSQLKKVQKADGSFRNEVQARWNEEQGNIPSFYIINALGSVIAGK